MSVGQAPLGSKSSLELGTKMGLVFQWSLCGVWRLLCRTVEELRGCILGKSTTRKANHLTAVAESRDNHTGELSNKTVLKLVILHHTVW